MKVLIAVDGTECSWMAINYVLHRSWHRSDEFKILTVVEPIPTEFGVDDGESQDDYNTNIVAACNFVTQKALRKLKSKFRHNKMSTEILSGNVPEQIVEYARQWSADLIVIGTHGHMDCRRFLHGSVAEAVLHHAPCSVEIVKIKQKMEQTASSSSPQI